MEKPIKDESMIEKASTIHEQTLLDFIEKQENYIEFLYENYDIEPKTFFDLIIRDCHYDEDVKNEHNRKRFNSIADAEAYIKEHINPEILDSDFIDTELVKAQQILNK